MLPFPLPRGHPYTNNLTVFHLQPHLKTLELTALTALTECHISLNLPQEIPWPVFCRYALSPQRLLMLHCRRYQYLVRCDSNASLCFSIGWLYLGGLGIG